MHQPKDDSVETHPLFPSGDWEGFYLYNNDGQEHKMAFFLNFKNKKVSGGGSDDVGGFSWKGTYDTEAMTCNMIKSYATHQINYKGRVDENGIWGKWYGVLEEEIDAAIMEILSPLMSGGFHIWPKGKVQKDTALESQSKIKSIEIETLV